MVNNYNCAIKTAKRPSCQVACNTVQNDRLNAIHPTLIITTIKLQTPSEPYDWRRKSQTFHPRGNCHSTATACRRALRLLGRKAGHSHGPAASFHHRIRSFSSLSPALLALRAFHSLFYTAFTKFSHPSTTGFFSPRSKRAFDYKPRTSAFFLKAQGSSSSNTR